MAVVPYQSPSMERHASVARRVGDSTADEAFWRACAMVSHLRDNDTSYRREMADIASRYNGDWIMPLRDVDGEPEFPAIAAQLIADTIDSDARRANGMMPVVTAPVEGGRQASDLQRRKAADRRKVWYGHWHDTQIDLKLARSYRHLSGYGTFGMFAVPDFSKQRAGIVTRDPLFTYSEPMEQDEIRAPRYVGFVHGRTPGALIAQFPEATDLIRRHTSSEEDLWDVLEWLDDGLLCGTPLHMFGILGRRYPDHRTRESSPGVGPTIYNDGPLEQAMLVRCFPNRAGRVPGVCPAAPALDRTASPLTRTLPIVDLLNKVYALNFIAAEKDIFPDRYAIGVEGRTPQILTGPWKDGRTGKMNLLKDVANIGELRDTPGPLTAQLMANLERNARLSSNNSSLTDGEVSGSIRSGQTVNQLAAIGIDPATAEQQRVMCYALAVVNEGVAEVEKGYWPDAYMCFFSGWKADEGDCEYQPKTLWTKTDNVVAYGMPGMDPQSATVTLGNLKQINAISDKSLRAKHPLIDDPDAEEQQITEELWKAGIQQVAVQQVTEGNVPFTALVDLYKKVLEGKDPVLAFADIQEELQKLQAEQPQDPAAAMPGLNNPAAGGQAPMPAPPPSGPEGVAAIAEALASAPPQQEGAPV